MMRVHVLRKFLPNSFSVVTFFFHCFIVNVRVSFDGNTFISPKRGLETCRTVISWDSTDRRLGQLQEMSRTDRRLVQLQE